MSAPLETIAELKDEIEKLKISPAEKSQVQNGIDKLSKISLHQRDPEAFQLVLKHTVKAARASINIQTLIPMIQKNLVPALAATGVKVAEAEDRKAAVDKNDLPNESKDESHYKMSSKGTTMRIEPKIKRKPKNKGEGK